MDKQRYDFIIGMQAGELINGVKSSKKSLEALKQNFKSTLDVLNTSPKQYGLTDTKQIIAARKEVEKLIREVEKLQAAGKTVLAGSGTKQNSATARQTAQLMAGVYQAQSAIQAATPSAIVKQQLKDDAIKTAALSKLQSKAITLRYALYDVGSAAQSASQALLGVAQAAITAAIAQETAFSQIQKTLVGQASVAELQQLKDELLDLSAQIPVTFGDLTKIGMLGSQLGIEAENIAKFTEVTAKFSAITGLSVEDTAMSFGKIANILGLSSDQYEALGSSIAAVGVRTAATEAQIISTAGQIGAVAKAAGFSASQIIGLSASFASLKIAPEEARGVVVRTFSEMSQAANSFNRNNGVGGEKLRVFANIAKMSSEDFAKGWGSGGQGAYTVFQNFVEGLKDGEIPRELQRISLDGVRTSKGLTALAGGFDSVFGPDGAIAIARDAGVKGTFLDESFGTIVEDVSSKIKLLENSFQNLSAAAGGGELARVIGVVVDGLTAMNEGLRNLIELPYIGSIVQFAVALTGLVGVLAVVASALAIAGGGALAIRTAFLAATTEGLIFKGSLFGIAAELLGIDVAAKTAAAGITTLDVAARRAAMGARLLKLAFATTGIGLIVLVISEIANALFEMSQETDGAVTGLDDVQKAQKELMDQTAATTQEMLDFMNQALLPIKNLVDVENSLYSLGGALKESANDFSIYSKAGRNNINALMATISAITTEAEGDQQAIADNLNALMQYMMASGLGVEAAFDIIRDAIAVTGLEAQNSVVNFASLIAGMQDITTSASGAAREVDKLKEAFEKLNNIINLEESLDAFGESLNQNGKNINSFSKNGRANFKALEDLIFALRDRLSNKPQSLANAFESLKVVMMQMGITSKFAFKTVDIAIGTTGKKGRALKKIIDGLFNTINESAEDTKPLTTITDYVNDLSSVLDDAFNNRYAKQDASDSISSAWISIKEAADDARKAIDEANASINEMQADKGILEYQLQVAIRYGDTLRAESIKAKLAKLNQNLAEKEQELADAQAEATKSLVGNSRYAIQNRARVRDLVQTYTDYLTSLAATGMSSDELKAQAATLANEFLTQGESMGFARSELLTYTDAFKNDFTTVIDNLPKDVTLNMVTDPALQAVVDFVKDANAELAKLLSGTVSVSIPGVTTGLGSSGGSGSNAGNGGGQGTTGRPGNQTNAPAPTATNAGDALALVDKRQAQLDSARAALNKQNASIQETQNTIKTLTQQRAALVPSKRADIEIKIDRMNEVLAIQQKSVRPLQQTVSAALQALKAAEASVPRLSGTPNSASQIPFRGMRDGGMVLGPGSGTSDSINARLSNGEYVLRANAVKYYGADFMNSLNQMQVQRPGATAGSNVVYLSPDDRALLRAAIDRPISLYTENTRIAESANSGNVVLAQRGMK